MIREIVRIDEELCDGCGLCVPACEEGAICVVNGKARVVSDRLCDGMGACLGHCPQGAISIERREAVPFDEAAVAAGGTGRGDRQPLPQVPLGPARSGHGGPAGGCPGARMAQFARPANAPVEAGAASARRSELGHWPVQLRLLPPDAPVLRGARLLVAADCVPVAYADFQGRLLRGRAVAIGCPKFDDLEAYVEKLAAMIRLNDLQEILVARMEVPCCVGLVTALLEAQRRAGVDVRITEVVIGTRGDLIAERELTFDRTVACGHPSGA